MPTPETFKAEKFGNLLAIKGISVSTFLADRKVAERQAESANRRLSEKGFKADIQIVYDSSNPVQKGSSLTLWAETSNGGILGSDSIGELRKTAEAVGKEAAERLLVEITSQATVDTFLADMLIPYMALSRGTSAYLTRAVTDHLETNIWLTEKFLGVRFNVNRVGQLYRVEKLAET